MTMISVVQAVQESGRTDRPARLEGDSELKPYAHSSGNRLPVLRKENERSKARFRGKPGFIYMGKLDQELILWKRQSQAGPMHVHGGVERSQYQKNIRR